MKNITPNEYACELIESVRDRSMQSDCYNKSVSLLMVDKLIEELNMLGQSIIHNHRDIRINYLLEVKKELENI